MNKKILLESIIKNLSKEIKKALNENTDGWNSDKMYDLIFILDKCYNLKYEIEHCIKGSYTYCKTYEDLADYIRQLGEELLDQADIIAEMQDEEEFED